MNASVPTLRYGYTTEISGDGFADAFPVGHGKAGCGAGSRTFWAEHGAASEDVRGFADDLFRVATDRNAEIDGLIERHAEHWRMERMAAVDRNLLRSAVAELLAYRETPRAVVINEALEIARKFSSPESVHFVNGVLDSNWERVGSSSRVPSPELRVPVPSCSSFLSIVLVYFF